jgi:hypothetical protein
VTITFASNEQIEILGENKCGRGFKTQIPVSDISIYFSSDLRGFASCNMWPRRRRRLGLHISPSCKRLSAMCRLRENNRASDFRIQQRTTSESPRFCLEWHLPLHCRWLNSYYLGLEGIRAALWRDGHSDRRNSPVFLLSRSAAFALVPPDCQWICHSNKLVNQANCNWQEWRSQETYVLGVVSACIELTKQWSDCSGLFEFQQIDFIERSDTHDMTSNDIRFVSFDPSKSTNLIDPPQSMQGEKETNIKCYSHCQAIMFKKYHSWILDLSIISEAYGSSLDNMVN